MKTLVIWHNLNDDSYYYRFVIVKKREYKVGYINQYNHQIIVIISSDEIQPIVIKEYISIRKAILTPIIKFLTWLNR